MNATDIRNDNWQEMRDGLTGLREAVYLALAKHGPCTTMQLAERANLSPWNVRPRVCELGEMGLVEVTGRSGRQGIYRAITMDEVKRRAIETRVHIEHHAEQMALL
jgi:sugar-specific transcriptional regulator TrmB